MIEWSGIAVVKGFVVSLMSFIATDLMLLILLLDYLRVAGVLGFCLALVWRGRVDYLFLM